MNTSGREPESPGNGAGDGPGGTPGTIRSLTLNSLVYGGADALSKFLLILLIPLYTRTLGLAEYGYYELLLVALGLCEIVADFGLSSALLRSRILLDVDARAHYGTAWLTQSALAVFLAALLMRVYPALGEALFGGRLTFVDVAAVAAALVLWALARVAAMHLRLRERSVAYGLLSILRLVTLFGVHAWLLLVLECGPAGLVAGLALAEGIYLVTVLWTARPPLSLKFRGSALRSMAPFGIPLVLVTFAHMTLNQIDRFMVQHFLGLEAVGLYTVGYKVGMAPSLIANAFQMAWLPVLYSIAQRPDARKIYARIFRYLFFLLAAAATGISIFAREIIQIIAVEPFYEAWAAIPPVAWSYVFVGGYFATAVGTNLTGRTYFQSMTMVGAAALNVGLNLWLIPAWGIQGAAWATLAAFMSMFTVHLVISVRLYPVPYEYRRITVMAVVAAGATVAGTVAGGTDAAVLLTRGVGFATVLGLLFLLSFDRDERRFFIDRIDRAFGIDRSP